MDETTAESSEEGVSPAPFDQDAAASGDDQAPAEPAGGASDAVPPHRRRHRGRRLALLVLALVMIVVLAVGGWYELQAHPGGAPGPAVVVTVSSGQGSSAVVGDLANRGVVTSGLAFRLYLLFHGTPEIQPGGYLFHRNLSFAAARQGLAAGPDVWPVAVPAGFTVSELAERIGELPGRDAHAFLTTADSGAVRSPWEASGSNSLEGLLAPGTYDVRPGETNRQVLQQMVTRFDQEAAQAGATPTAAAALGVTPNQLVTVASIVEKEGVIPENLGRVSRVIYNRLANDMPLQMDSTVLYSLGRDGGQVTSADEQIDTPYNTYLHTGLTPTPIAFPSQGALRAAAHPPAGPWLFFVVVSNSGKEAFSTTYAEQLANEALARRRGIG